MSIECDDFALHRRFGFHQDDGVTGWCTACSPTDPMDRDITDDARTTAHEDEPVKPTFTSSSPDLARLFGRDALDPRNR